MIRALDSARRFAGMFLLIALSTGTVLAQQTPTLSLDISRPLFAVLAGMNACGYDEDLASSNPLRSQLRADIARSAKTAEAKESLNRMCRFYVDHMQADPTRQLAQYVSLALNLDDTFTPRGKEADLPPDAIYVLGFVPLVQSFYANAELQKLFVARRAAYDTLIEQYQGPVSNVLLATDLYLKLPLSSYLGRGFTVYVEPLSAPGHVNARVYGENYSMVISPTPTGLKLEQIRHTYLHYILDPLIAKRAISLARLRPLLQTISDAPLADSYKQDIGLLVTESMIRAIEARTLKAPEAARAAAMDKSMSEGFILTRYFYDDLVAFEKTPTGFRDVYADWLRELDVKKEMKLGAQVRFASSASQEVVRPERELTLVDLAEKQLGNGNPELAQKLAQQALDENKGDAGHATFVLARAFTAQGDMKGAQLYFERTLTKSNDPKITAWSHIYLGRIADLQEERETALKHYQAALAADDKSPEMRAAAERGLRQPYEPPQHEDKDSK